MRDDGHIIFDGQLIPANQTIAPAHSRGLMYGDGIFETLRSYSAQTFLLQQHLGRLKEGLRILKIPFPSPLKIERFEPLIYELLEANDLLKNDAIIRMQAWREGNRGYRPDVKVPAHFSVIASRCPQRFKNPALATVKTRRIPSRSLPSAYKFSNGINYILAASEAAEKGADDALMQTIDRKISETTIANIFWVKDNTVFTPSINCDLVPGITRSIVIDLAADSSSLEEGEFELPAILEADAVFLTNSVREILPVKAVNDHSFDVEDKTVNALKDNFLAFRNEFLKPLK